MAKRVQTTAAELDVRTGKLASGMRRAERIVSKSTRNMAREMSRVESPVSRQAGGAAARGGRAGRLGGMMGGAGQMLKGAAVFGGVYGISNEIKKAKAFEEVLVDVAVRGQKSKAWVNDLRGSMMALSNEYGIGKDHLAAYVGTIIDQTGNTELAVSTLKSMTAVAFSANVPMKELAGTVVEMQSKLALSPHQFETALGILAAQADKGKVPLSQMSKYLPEVLNATVQFGHTGVGALRDYGAVLQMAARGAGSLAEANTAMNRMLDQTAAKRGKIEKALNIKLKKDGAWLQLAPMLKEIVGGLIRFKAKGKDVEKLIVQMWGIRGKKAILPLLQQGMTGWDQRVGAAGGKGGLTSFDALRQAGGAGTIQARVARKRKLSPELDAWNRSVEKLKNKLHMHLLPAINKLGDVIPHISSALEWMIDNWKLLLAVWAGGKMLRFLSSLKGLAGGGGRIAGGVASMFGSAGGGAAGGGAAATGGAASVGGAGFIGGLSTASAALGAFAVSIAPAVAGLKAMGDAYDKKKQKELRDKLTKSVRKAKKGTMGALYEKLGIQGEMSGFRSIDDIGKETSAQKREFDTRMKYKLRSSESREMMGAFQAMSGGQYNKASFQLGQVDPFGERVSKLAGASDYELGAMGLTRAAVTELINLSKLSQSRLDAAEEAAKTANDRAKVIESFLKTGKTPVVKVTIIDPNKTAAGVTNGRRGKKK